MSDNQLAKETSPYLQLHKDNPVHWRPWGPEALAEAKEKNKPILLSIGYTACHWCHVMNHESFADPETAAQMNELFVNIKVDREERPDIDQLYQTAAIHMGHSGGWPLTMFLSPDGKPYLAGGYIPLKSVDGRSTFSDAMKEASTVYRDDPARVARTNETVQNSLADIWSRDFRTNGFPPTVLEYVTIRIGQRFDIFYGGIIGAPKFHSSGLLEFLFRGYLRTGAPQLQQLVRTAVDHMSLGGIYDHLAGGFFRYATDDRWLIPHFEKMLYDNSEIVELLTLLWQNTRIKLYADRVEETIGWLLRDMRKGDAFVSSIDADSEGEEGRYYLWTEPEIDAAIAGTFSQRFKQIYGITRAGNFAGRNILHRLVSSAIPLSDADDALLKKQREMMLEARGKRVAPMRDDKILADWNAMAIVALARAGAAFRRKEWTTAAIKAFDFIVKHLGEGDRLYHSLSEGKRQHMAFAEDYAQMARAAYVLFEVTGEKRFLNHAQTWVRVMNTHFWDNEKFGYFFTADDDEPLIIRVRMAADQATPSANGLMVGVLWQLYQATSDRSYLERANMLMQAFSGELGNRYISYGAYLNGLDSVSAGIQIVIVGPRNNAKTQELIAAVHGRALPSATLLVVEPDQKFPELHPAFGKTMQGGVPTAYICQQQSCGAPITSPVALSQMLQLPAQMAVAGRA